MTGRARAGRCEWAARLAGDALAESPPTGAARRLHEDLSVRLREAQGSEWRRDGGRVSLLDIARSARELAGAEGPATGIVRPRGRTRRRAPMIVADEERFAFLATRDESLLARYRDGPFLLLRDGVVAGRVLAGRADVRAWLDWMAEFEARLAGLEGELSLFSGGLGRP